MKGKILTLALLLLTGSLGYLLIQAISDRRRSESELAEARASIEKIQAELNELKKARIAEADLARLKADQRDAITLRGEVASLKQSLSSAQKAAADAQKMASAGKAPSAANPEPIFKIDPLPENNPEVVVHKTRLFSAQLASGQGLVLGGWQGSSGKRIFALVQPVRIDAAGNQIDGDAPSAGVADQITVTTKWVEASNESAAKLGLSNYLDNSGEQTALVDKAAFGDWLKTIQASEGVDVLNLPTVTTMSGRQARVSVAESHTTAAGPVELGPKMDLLPTVSEDGQIRIAIQASLTETPPK